MEEVAKDLLRPGSWVVQGTLGLAYPGSFESHVCLAEWWVGLDLHLDDEMLVCCECILRRFLCCIGGAADVRGRWVGVVICVMCCALSCKGAETLDSRAEPLLSLGQNRSLVLNPAMLYRGPPRRYAAMGRGACYKP